MVTPLQSLRLPIGHPLVEILCDLSLKDKAAFNEESPINFKKEVSEEDKIKFKQALRVLRAIVSNEASLRYFSDENQKFIEDLAQAEKITNELVEKTLEIVSYSDVDVDFEAFKNAMLKVDFKAVGLKSYSQSQLLDLDGGHWDLEVPSSSKESVIFRFDNLPQDHNGKEENFYARSSLKDLEKTGIVAIDFGTKSTTAIYMNKNGRYCIDRCINNMHNGVFLKYFLSYPIKYEKHQAEKIRESFEKGLRKSLPRHVFDDEKTAKNFKVELRASLAHMPLAL
ncbi:dihydrolipoamide acetyltransferase [Helicobacter pylori]|uniref:dihydrolipoamide acetyltransferase n=1 Tax=Helicobacter pylori TaxID=210 RepID=UPI001F50754F|nr:dihydrolipoamide acetyltransferase [Helicobacter pylori]